MKLRNARIWALVFALALFAPAAARADIDTGFDADHVRMINAQRSTNGVREVAASEALNRAARIRAKEIARAWGDTRPDGSLWSTVLTEVSSADFGRCGENISAGETMLDEERVPGSIFANVLDARFTHVGVATYIVDEGDPNPIGHRVYWVQIFAERAPDSFTPGGGQLGAVLFGSAHVWRQGSRADGITIIGEREYAEPISVQIDGADIDARNWKVSRAAPPYSGRLQIKLESMMLDWLDAGRHDVIVLLSQLPLTFPFSTVRYDRDYSASFDVTPERWSRGRKEAMRLRAPDIDASRIVGVIIDDTALDNTRSSTGYGYRVERRDGGSDVLIGADAINSLSDAEHVVTIALLDGAATKTIEVVPGGGAVTGSSGGGGCDAGALSLALVALAISARRRK